MSRVLGDTFLFFGPSSGWAELVSPVGFLGFDLVLAE